MATRIETVRAKVTEETKAKAERILDQLGLSMSDAINLMLIQIALTGGLPFKITLSHIPNAETLKTFEETDHNIELIKSKNTKELFKKLGI